MTFHNLLFTEVDCTRTELRDLQQEIASNCGLNETLKNIPRRPQTSSTSILGPQKFNVLHDNQRVESTTSTMV